MPNFIDEPTSGLDVMAREGILDALRAYMEQEERAILISSHISGDLENLCDDLYLIDQGKIRLHEDTDVLLDQYGILRRFWISLSHRSETILHGKYAADRD